MAIIALDLGGTKMAAAVFSPSGKILDRSIVALEGRGGRAVGKLIRQEIETLLAFARANKIRITAIGVSIPGISHARTGKVWAPNIPGWKNYPLRREIQSALSNAPVGYVPPRGAVSPVGRPPRGAVPIIIDSDRACSILGETWLGVAKGCRNAIFLAVGTGIGAGILVDGTVLRGIHDIAGAIGWMALNRPFRPEYIKCGCFEHHASGEGLAKIAREMQTAAHSHAPTPRRPGTPTPKRSHELFAAYDRGDPLAKAVLGQAVEFWGMATANLVSLFNPEKIIFGGGVFGPATKFLDAIYAKAKKWAQPVSIKHVKLQPSKLGSDAPLYGAAWLALNQPQR